MPPFRYAGTAKTSNHQVHSWWRRPALPRRPPIFRSPRSTLISYPLSRKLCRQSPAWLSAGVTALSRDWSLGPYSRRSGFLYYLCVHRAFALPVFATRALVREFGLVSVLTVSRSHARICANDGRLSLYSNHSRRVKNNHSSRRERLRSNHDGIRPNTERFHYRLRDTEEFVAAEIQMLLSASRPNVDGDSVFKFGSIALSDVEKFLLSLC